MFETSQFKLPLLQAAQAQKHVTVNEALARLDALCQLRFLSRTVAVPPVSPIDGDAYLVPVGASGDWTGNDGDVAIFSNGGWVFLTTQEGWKAYVVDSAESIARTGPDWINEVDGVQSSGGAKTEAKILEFDHVVTAGAVNTTSVVIPSSTLVQAVSARVIVGIDAGTASTWRIGVSGSDDRYGNGLGLSVGSYALGLTGNPLAYYSDTGLLITPDGDDFVSGTIRICIHYSQFTPPN